MDKVMWPLVAVLLAGLCFVLHLFLFVSLQCAFCSDTYGSRDSVKEYYNSADAVLIGKIEDMRVAKRRLFFFPTEYTLTLSVKKAWKGASQRTFVIRTASSRAHCGSAFRKGESYLILAGENRILIKHLAKAGEEFEYLNSIYLTLPKPSGPYVIGTKDFYFVDRARPESFTPDPDDHREVAVRIWYPAVAPKDGRPVNLVENAQELGRIYASYSPLPPTVFDPLRSVRTHSYRDANILKNSGPFPLLLFSHAYWAGMTQSTVLMEGLASHGYVVASVGHAHETSHFLKPDGSIKAFDPTNAEFRLRGVERKNTIDIQRKIIQTQNPGELVALLHEHSKKRPKTVESLHIWADDISFVINKLKELNRGSGFFSGRLDTTRIGVLGHSFGGVASAQVCLTDSRCKAGINIDGLQLGDLLQKDLTKPFMFIHHDNVGAKNKTPNRYFFDRAKNTAYLLLVRESRHLNFSDVSIPGYASVFQLPPDALGEIDGRRCLKIQNGYCLAFFDKHLKGVNSDLLSGPSDEYPEVKIWIREL